MINQIKSNLQSHKVENRLQALNLLGKLTPDEAVPILLGLLRDPSSYILVKVVRLLGKMEGEKILGKIYECYAWIEDNPTEKDPYCEVRGEIIALIGAYRDIHAVDWLYRALKTTQIKANTDMSLQLRANAALILSDFRVRGLLADLSLLLFDFEPNISVQTADEYRYANMLTRQAAAKGIGIYGDSLWWSYPCSEINLSRSRIA